MYLWRAYQNIPTDCMVPLPSGRASDFESGTQNITKTFLCNVCLLIPHFYIEKLGNAGIHLFLAHLSLRLTGELIVYPCSGVRPSVRPSFTFSKIFSSETAWPIKAKLHVEHP